MTENNDYLEDLQVITKRHPGNKDVSALVEALKVVLHLDEVETDDDETPFDVGERLGYNSALRITKGRIKESLAEVQVKAEER